MLAGIRRCLPVSGSTLVPVAPVFVFCASVQCLAIRIGISSVLLECNSEPLLYTLVLLWCQRSNSEPLLYLMRVCIGATLTASHSCIWGGHQCCVYCNSEPYPRTCGWVCVSDSNSEPFLCLCDW